MRSKRLSALRERDCSGEVSLGHMQSNGLLMRGARSCSQRVSVGVICGAVGMLARGQCILSGPKIIVYVVYI